jgi:hypothetical protein
LEHAAKNRGLLGSVKRYSLNSGKVALQLARDDFSRAGVFYVKENDLRRPGPYNAV